MCLPTDRGGIGHFGRYHDQSSCLCCDIPNSRRLKGANSDRALSAMSLINTKNMRRLRTAICGTPDLTGTCLNAAPLRTDCWVLFVIHAFIQHTVVIDFIQQYRVGHSIKSFIKVKDGHIYLLFFFKRLREILYCLHELGFA